MLRHTGHVASFPEHDTQQTRWEQDKKRMLAGVDRHTVHAMLLLTVSSSSCMERWTGSEKMRTQVKYIFLKKTKKQKNKKNNLFTLNEDCLLQLRKTQ